MFFFLLPLKRARLAVFSISIVSCWLQFYNSIIDALFSWQQMDFSFSSFEKV